MSPTNLQTSYFSDEGKPSHLPLVQVMRDLIRQPQPLMASLRNGKLNHPDVLLKSLTFLLFASLFFAVTSVIYYPPNWQLNQWQLTMRFFVTFASMLVLMLPIMTLIWATLQRMSAWFWNIPITFGQTFGIAGLSLFYNALMFLISIPVFLAFSSQGYLLQGVLFLLNLTSFTLSVRLFKVAYQTFSEVSRKKALGVALFPVVLMLLVYAATQLLAYLAVHPHFK